MIPEKAAGLNGLVRLAVGSRLAQDAGFLSGAGVVMSWVYLLLAGAFEIGWPVGLKMAQALQTRWLGVLVAVLCMALSGYFLWLAQRQIPMGTAYAVWTGIGAVGAFVVGVMYYGDPATFWRCVGVGLIVAGVVTLKLAH